MIQQYDKSLLSLIVESVDNNEGYPKKRAINKYDEIVELKLIARASNALYCFPFNKIGPGQQSKVTVDVIKEEEAKSIIISFKGPDLIKTQWQTRKNQLITFSVPGMEKNELVKVDQEWFDDISIMWEPLLKNVKFELKNTGFTKILFCGHGVGGAYAAIAGLSFAIMNLLDLNLSLDISVGTLGQPRTGNIMFARMMNDIVKVTRITLHNDYFPHFPPIENQRTIMQHHEREIWIEIDCNCPQNTEGVVWDCGKFEKNEEKRLAGVRQFIQEKFWIPGDDLAMENKECNAGQTITDSSRDNHFGPYFGITIGDCRNL
ncbi:hypothetical protein G9A89_001461 [Geosiphon pyriformis]|nr:hypothetical protein G9A89_001461 [Geosiphon pyriformis]